MELKDELEVANTRAKLAELETRHEELREDTSLAPEVRRITMKSLMRYINQFKEEIARFEAHPNESIQASVCQHGIQTESQLVNTREKLKHLESLLAENQDRGRDEEFRRAERISIRRLINQLKEEIARYQARHPVGK